MYWDRKRKDFFCVGILSFILLPTNRPISDRTNEICMPNLGVVQQVLMDVLEDSCTIHILKPPTLNTVL